LDENHSADHDGEIRSVEPGSPHNDQMLAQTREDLRNLLDVTIHPIIDQAEAQDADLAAMMAVLASSWIERVDYMPRERLASVLALTLFKLANEERELVSDGKTVKR